MVTFNKINKQINIKNMLLKLNTKSKNKKHIVSINDNKLTIQWNNLVMPQCMLGVMGKFCTVLVPSMHCSMKLLIVTIVEIHMFNVVLWVTIVQQSRA